MEKKTWTWWTDFILVCSVLLLAESARGVVIGTLSPYLTSLGGDSFLLGVTVAVFSVGRLIASFAFGVLSDYWSTRAVLVLSCVGCVIGDFLFCFAQTITSVYMLLFSRILTGFGTGMLSVARTHITVTTPSDERTLWMSWLGIVQFVGFAITPALGNIDVNLDLYILQINNYTFATLILFLLEVMLVVLVALFMSKKTVKERSNEKKEAESAALSSLTQPIVNGNEFKSESPYHGLPDDEHSNEDNAITRHLSHAERQASAAELQLDEESQREVYLDEDVHTAQSYTSEHLTPQRQHSHGTSDEGREVIIYFEDTDNKNPNTTVYTPHHFVFNVDRSSNTQGTLTRRSSLAEIENPAPTIVAVHHDETISSDPPPLVQRIVDFFSASSVPLAFVVLNLSARGALSVAEAYGTQMYNDITDPGDPTPSSSPASNFFLILGCCGLVVFLAMSKLTKYISETNLLMFAFISMGIGFGVLVDLDDYDLDITDLAGGFTLIWVIATPISQTLSVSMLSRYFTEQTKLGNPPARGAGFWMGLVTAAGSVGRIIFPLVAGSLYEPYGVSSAMLFTSLVSFLTVLVIIFPLKAYSPYIRHIKDRFTCCGGFFYTSLSDDEEPVHKQQEGQNQMTGIGPLLLSRGNSLDKTEMLAVPDHAMLSLAANQSVAVQPSPSSSPRSEAEQPLVFIATTSHHTLDPATVRSVHRFSFSAVSPQMLPQTTSSTAATATTTPAAVRSSTGTSVPSTEM